MAWKKLYIKPNKAAQKAAKRGLEARKKAPKSKRGGLDAIQASVEGVGSGVLRARDIVAGKRVNAYQVNAFFNRHLKNYVNASIEGLKPVESKAIQSWLLWGGEPLRKQAAAAVRKDKAKRNPIETRSLTDDEIEDQMAAIGCLIEKSARNSDDYPHEAERSLPQTRRVWGLYKSLEKEQNRRGAKRNPMPRRDDGYPSEWLFDQLMNGNKKVLWLSNYVDYRDGDWRKEAEEKGFKTIVIKPREKDFDRDDWSEMVEGMGVDAPDGAVPEQWIVYEDSKDGKGKAQRFKKILTGEANLTREGYLREMGDILGYDKDQTNEMAADLFIPAEELMKTIDEYCGRTERRDNPSIDRSGMISYGEYYGLPDGDGGYDLYYKDRLIASGVQTVREAEEEITRHADLA